MGFHLKDPPTRLLTPSFSLLLAFWNTNGKSMMMQTGAQSWEELRRAARTAERHLEDKIAAYTAISKAATRAPADYDVGTCACFSFLGLVGG